jgi:hypothetical protein
VDVAAEHLLLQELPRRQVERFDRPEELIFFEKKNGFNWF